MAFLLSLADLLSQRVTRRTRCPDLSINGTVNALYLNN